MITKWLYQHVYNTINVSNSCFWEGHCILLLYVIFWAAWKKQPQAFCNSNNAFFPLYDGPPNAHSNYFQHYFPACVCVCVDINATVKSSRIWQKMLSGGMTLMGAALERNEVNFTVTEQGSKNKRHTQLNVL